MSKKEGDSMAYRLLVIEDDSRMREIVRDYFTAKGFAVSEAADGAEALGKLNETVYDLVLLDIMMPKLDGFAVCRRIRENSSVPVIFITARSREGDMLAGYELGADDYVTKPFSLPVLHAKALALLARTKNGEGKVYDLNGLTVDTGRRTVAVNGQPVALAPKEYELLLYLIENRGLVLSREQILNAVWGIDWFGDERAVDTHIKKLRKALGSQSRRVRTIIKGGYRFEDA